MKVSIWGQRSRLGLGLAGLVFLIDRANKAWFLDGLELGRQGPIEVAPFLDLVLVWNRGVSYGLLQQDGDIGRLALIVFALVVSCGLVGWLARVDDKSTALAIGLVIGGAIGNAADRLIFGAVADFYRLHAFGLSWYVFNLADAAIVAGVAILLYGSIVVGHKDAEKNG